MCRVSRPGREKRTVCHPPCSGGARLLYEANRQGDIRGMRVVDLGCGTGILACGAALLGAGEVIGIDWDRGALAVARENAAALGCDVTFLEADVSRSGADIPPADTVIMNPPFGAQRPMRIGRSSTPGLLPQRWYGGVSSTAGRVPFWSHTFAAGPSLTPRFQPHFPSAGPLPITPAISWQSLSTLSVWCVPEKMNYDKPPAHHGPFRGPCGDRYLLPPRALGHPATSDT